uniref:Uncharacterized protein n=1 Tax=Arundo donax TaxID=35708 RepID=A0A0A9DEN1_ARUDO
MHLIWTLLFHSCYHKSAPTHATHARKHLSYHIEYLRRLIF